MISCFGEAKCDFFTDTASRTCHQGDFPLSRLHELTWINRWIVISSLTKCELCQGWRCCRIAWWCHLAVYTISIPIGLQIKAVLVRTRRQSHTCRAHNVELELVGIAKSPQWRGRVVEMATPQRLDCRQTLSLIEPESVTKNMGTSSKLLVSDLTCTLVDFDYG